MTHEHAKPGSGGILASVLPYSKAVAGALFFGGAMWLKVRGHGVTDDELWQILGAALSGGGVVFAVPNRDPRGKKQDESVQPPESTPDRVRKHLNRKGLA